MSMARERGGKGVEGKRTQQVAAHSGLDLGYTAFGGFDPGESGLLRQGGQLFLKIDVANEGCGAGLEEQDVLEEAQKGAEQLGGLFLAFRSCAIGLGHFEERGEVGSAERVVKDEQGVGAAGEIAFEIEAEGPAYGS